MTILSLIWLFTGIGFLVSLFFAKVLREPAYYGYFVFELTVAVSYTIYEVIFL